MSSQRIFTLVSVVLVSVIITVIAVAQGHVIDIGVTGLTESVLALLVPLTAAASSLRSFYSVLDEEIVSGRLDANAIPPLFGMSAYWTVLVLWIATTVQVIGLDIINNDTQTLFVAGLTTLGGVLLDSFSKRANGATSYSLKMGDKSAGAAYRSPAGDHRHG